MRREGYEFQVSRPKVIFKTIDGQQQEPYEELTIEVPEESQGKVIENLGLRKGEMVDMSQDQGITKMTYKIPTRGLLGFRSEFMTETKGLGIMNYRFEEYGPYLAQSKHENGVMVSKETSTTIAYALFNLQERGRFLWVQV